MRLICEGESGYRYYPTISFSMRIFFICGNVQLSRPGQSLNCVGNTHKVA